MERGGYFAPPYNPETDPWHEQEGDPEQAHPLPAQLTAGEMALRFGFPWYDAQGNLVLPSPSVPGSAGWMGHPHAADTAPAQQQQQTRGGPPGHQQPSTAAAAGGHPQATRGSTPKPRKPRRAQPQQQPQAPPPAEGQAVEPTPTQDDPQLRLRLTGTRPAAATNPPTFAAWATQPQAQANATATAAAATPWIPPPWETQATHEGTAQGGIPPHNAATPSTEPPTQPHEQSNAAADPAAGDTTGGPAHDTAAASSSSSAHPGGGTRPETRVPPGTKAIPGMTMREHYMWVTTGEIAQSYIDRELTPGGDDQGDAEEAAAEGEQGGGWGDNTNSRRRAATTAPGPSQRKHEGGGADRTRNKRIKYHMKLYLRRHGLMHTRWGGPVPAPADQHPRAASSTDPQPQQQGGTQGTGDNTADTDTHPAGGAGATTTHGNNGTNFADLLNRHLLPRGTYPSQEQPPPAATTAAEPDPTSKAHTYYPHWDPRKSTRQRAAAAAEGRRQQYQAAAAASSSTARSSTDQAPQADRAAQPQTAATPATTSSSRADTAGQQDATAGSSSSRPQNSQRTSERAPHASTRTWDTASTAQGEDSQQGAAASHSSPPQQGETHHAAASSSGHNPPQHGGEQPSRPYTSDPLWDGRTLRLSSKEKGANSGPAPWVQMVRDGRNIGKRPTPATPPAPSPTPAPRGGEHTDLMQRFTSNPQAQLTAAQQALQAANRRGDTAAMAMQQQLQLIHETAEQVGGQQGAAITTLCDVLARQISLLVPTGALPETCKADRKRALTEPNVLVEALSLTSRFSYSGGASLTAEERAQDMAFLIRVLEMGESQLMEPTPPDVGDEAVQEAKRSLLRAQHIAAQLRDRALRGEPWWDLPMDLWEQLRRHTAPAAYIIERRGEAFQNEEEPAKQARKADSEPARGSNDPAPSAHPADVLTLAAGGEEAEARTSTTTTAFLLLLEAVQALRDLTPCLGGGPGNSGEPNAPCRGASGTSLVWGCLGDPQHHTDGACG